MKKKQETLFQIFKVQCEGTQAYFMRMQKHNLKAIYEMIYAI